MECTINSNTSSSLPLGYLPREYTETIITKGEEYYSALLKDIANAKKSIDLEAHIYHRDAVGDQITEALVAAAQRGVAVRVLVDGAGTPRWGATYAKQLESAGVLTKTFHPFPWQIWNWSRSVVKLPRIMRWFYLFLKANSRNHRKVCLIDHCIAYIGSFNVVADHLPKSMGGKEWRDTAVRLAQTNIEVLEAAFQTVWNQRTIPERLRDAFRYVNKNPLFRLNYNRHRRRVLHKNLLKRMARCRQRIWITNAYFVPDNFLLRTLREAAALGVDVRVLLPKKSNVFFMTWASSAFYRSLLKAGVRIFEYLPSMLHAKTLILDDWMLVGSSNLNHRSLLHDLEVDVNIRSESAKKSLEHSFLEDLKQSEELSLDRWQMRSRWQRFMGYIFLYLKYWI